MRLLTAAAALLLAAPAAAQQSAGLTIEEAVSVAVRNSPAVLSAEQDIIIARKRVSEARFLALPQFTLSGTLNRMDLEYPAVLSSDLGGSFVDPLAGDTFYSLKAQALQPLYTGGKNTNTLKLAKTAHNRAKVNFEAAKSAAALGAKKAFYALLYQERLKEAVAYWLRRATELSGGLRKGPYEELEASVLLSLLEGRLRLAGDGLEAAHTDLLKALNKEPGFEAEARGEFRVLPVPEDVNRSLVTAMESRPELKSEIYKAQMDDIAVNMAMIKRYPTIYLGATYDVTSYRFSSLAEAGERSGSWLASVAIKFPLSYDIWTQVQQRRAQQRQGELKRVELQDTIRFGIISAHKTARSRQEEASRLGSELDRMKKAYETASRSARPSMSALRALKSLCDLEQRMLDSVHAQLLARIRLEWAQGRDF